MIQIVSPHIDDAFLSLGGAMLNWKKLGREIKVLNVFSKSDYTSKKAIWDRCVEPDATIVSKIRLEEEETLSKLVGFNFSCLGFPDWPLRQKWQKDAEDKMIAEIKEQIFQQLDQRDQIFFPLGIAHPDHLIIKSMSDLFYAKECQLYFYEDMPHLSWGNHNHSQLFVQSCTNNYPIVEKIDFEQKSRFLRNYASQIEESWLKAMMTYSYSVTDNCHYERYWQCNISQ